MPCPTWRPSTRRLGLSLLLSCHLFITSYFRSKPEFSSWSLVCMGSSHLYRFHEGQNFWSTLYLKLCFSNISISHSSGLGQQPGFISSAKFLLPWEVNFSKKEVCRKCLFTFKVPLTKATRPQLEAKWPSILENHAKRATLRSPDEPAEDKITVKVWAKTLHI